MPHSVDVAVVGAGPAGAAAAITLARAGRRVLLVDRARFPRDKTCGDGLTAAALRLLQSLGLRPESVASWRPVADVVVRSPSGRAVTFPLPRDRGVFAAVATRHDLDAALLDVARRSGAAVADGHAVVGAETTRTGVCLTVDGLGEVRARAAVAADGVWSPVRRFLGRHEDGYRGEWHAFRQYFEGVTGPAAGQMWVLFEPDVLPGYAWSFPLPGGCANVGFGILRQGPVRVPDMKELWPDLLSRPHVRDMLGPDAKPVALHRAWPIPARIDRAVLHSGPVLFAGDAAGAADPMTGEGIAQALFTGIRAAEALCAHDEPGPAYAAAVKRELVADHRMSSALTRVLRHSWGARAAVRAAGANEWTRRHFARWLFEDYPRAVAVTPRRWRRGMFNGAGAYVPPN